MEGSTLRVWAHLDGDWLRPEVGSALSSTRPLVFTYSFQLLRSRRLWFDKTLWETQIRRVAVFDNLSRQWTLWTEYGEEESGRTVVDRKEKALQYLATPPPITLPFPMQKEKRPLELRAKVHLLNDFALIIPWDLETGWAKVRVKP